MDTNVAGLLGQANKYGKARPTGSRNKSTLALESWRAEIEESLYVNGNQ